MRIRLAGSEFVYLWATLPVAKCVPGDDSVTFLIWAECRLLIGRGEYFLCFLALVIPKSHRTCTANTKYVHSSEKKQFARENKFVFVIWSAKLSRIVITRSRFGI